MARKVLVTGGAGFVGCNLVDRLLAANNQVTIFDSFSRAGSECNLEWLERRHTDRELTVLRGDVRDADAVDGAAFDVDVVYHLAGQVAVTTSVVDPRTDFEVNALGTLNVLEAARRSVRRPVVVFTSTNKVYGTMDDLELVEDTTRYTFRDLPFGISEHRALDFHSPYGCSKGTADQYVRDYSRIYDLPTVVFRMSCIYGPRQFGTEDQGWLANFMIAAVTGRPITIFGDGKQVRDVLFIDDLVRALQLAVDHIERTAGSVYNIGGGPMNTVSVWAEFRKVLACLHGDDLAVGHEPRRPGDQRCYVSDIRKAERTMGWRPEVDVVTGVRRLWEWVAAHEHLFATAAPAAASTG